MRNFQFLTFFLLGFLTSSFTFAETQTGAIEGTVQDNDGRGIPGVTVTASSPSLIGGSTIGYTDRDGSCRFPWLPSGIYEVQAQLSGFQTVIQKDVRVFVGKTLTVHFRLEFVEVTESVEVRENPPLIDVSTTAVSFNVPPEIIRNLPKVQRIQDLIALTPGVIEGDRVVIEDQLTAYGAEGESANAYSVDGVSVTSPRTGTLFGEFNYNWIDEVHVVGIGAPAEYGGFSGVSANFITRSGGNQFHGLFETFFQNEKLTDTNTPDPETEHPFTSYDISTQMGGPILHDRLWFFTGFEYSQRESHPVGFEGVTRETLPKFITKLNYKLNENNSLQGYFHRNDPYGEDLGADSSLVSPEATSTVEATQSSWNATWISLFSSATSFEGRLGGFYDRSRPVEENPDLPGHIDNPTGIVSVNAIQGVNEKQSRLQLNATLSHYASDFLLGAHDFRFGVEFERSDEFNETYLNGGMFYYDYYGAPYQRNFIDGQAFQGDTHRAGSFAQDEWNITDRLRLSLGVRWDHNRGITDKGVVFATDPVAPRIGFVWSLDKNNQTVIKAHYGDYYDALKGQHYFFLSEDAHHTVITQQIDENGQWIEISRLRDNFAVGDQKLKHPFARQFSIGVDHVLPFEIPVGAHYIYRRFGNILDDVGLEGYEPFPFVNPLSGETITVYNRVDDEITLFFTNPPDIYRQYNGFEVYATKQIANNVSVSGSFVYSKLDGYPSGNTSTFFYDTPNSLIHVPGRLAESFSWKFVGTYAFPWGFNAGWYFRHESGRTWSAIVRVADLNTLQLILAEPAGSRQLPSQNLLDMRVEKEFPFYGGHLRFTADVFNVMNSATVLNVVRRFDKSDFGQPRLYNEPRQIRLGLRYTF